MPKWVIAVILLFCALQSVTKGWYMFILVPVSLAILPVVALLHSAINKLGKTDRLLPGGRVVQIAQLTTLALFYLSLPGFGDSHEGVLFGFYMAELSSPIAVLATTVADVMLPVAFVLTIVLVGYAVLKKKGSS